MASSFGEYHKTDRAQKKKLKSGTFFGIKLVDNREDFRASTSNKQLNFLLHIFTILKQHGRAAVSPLWPSAVWWARTQISWQPDLAGPAPPLGKRL